jgi:hypothetical protein
VGEVDEFGKGGAESRDICGGVKEWRILLDEEVLHFPGSVLGGFVFCWTVLGGLYLGLVVELLLFSGYGVNDWW